MSDMPMRLKYLTKMKIILCIFLLYITAVSVFSQSQELNGIVGKSIEFPAAVKTGGSLMYGSKVIGRILSGALLPLTNPEYQGRVQWDKRHFSLSELRLEDSGVYTVENDGQTSVSTFNLTVWEDNVNVSKPNVSITRNEYPCTIECTAERGTGVTLSWYKEGQKKPYVSSRVASAPHLHLPQAMERSGTYTCEAKNSVSNEKASITVGVHCTDPIIRILIAVVVILLVALVAAVAYGVWSRFCRKDQQASVQAAIKLINSVVQPVYDDGEPMSALSPDDAAGILIQVKQLLINVVPNTDGLRGLLKRGRK